MKIKMLKKKKIFLQNVHIYLHHRRQFILLPYVVGLMHECMGDYCLAEAQSEWWALIQIIIITYKCFLIYYSVCGGSDQSWFNSVSDRPNDRLCLISIAVYIPLHVVMFIYINIFYKQANLAMYMIGSTSGWVLTEYTSVLYMQDKCNIYHLQTPAHIPPTNTGTPGHVA